MNLININTRSVTRLQFANLESQNVWGQKINNIQDFYPALEFLTVQHDVRPCMIQHYADPNSLEHYMRELSKVGLLFVPLQKEIKDPNFSHVSTVYNGSGDYVYRGVVTKSIAIADEFANAHHNSDDIKIGELLGYPKKSSIFFEDAWKKGHIDPIWQQAENTREENIVFKKQFKDSEGNVTKHLIAIKDNPKYNNIGSVMRYINARLISHLPSSFDEDESVLVANDWMQLAKDLKLKGLDDTIDILNLPYEWDCYKGYAEVNTPVFKILNPSVPCYPHYTVWKQSDFYPKEAPFGNRFPWKNKMFSN